MASKTPTWVWVVLGIVGFFVLACAVLVGGGILMVRRHVHTEFAEKQTADQEFARQRARFAGQQPLVELRKTANDDDKMIVHRPAESAPRRTDLQTIRVLVYDSREGRLIHIDVPLWIMRMMPASNRGTRGRQMTLRGNGLDFDFNNGDLTLEDVERHGPGLVVDGVDSRGAQVLVWAE
jgi:hypothetical protein